MRTTRRRFLTLASAACLMAPAAQAFRWQGTALGAKAQIILDHPDAEAITQSALAEIRRMEGIFSLYRTESEIVRLNADGRLAAPSFELLDCLGTAARVYRATDGLFDPTVQPLWQVMAAAHAENRTPAEEDLGAARALIGFDRARYDAQAVILGKGQSLTLNGIAQGYIADRVAKLMKAQGVSDVLIDTGEILAMGGAKGKDHWPVTIHGEARARALNGRALATSAWLGTVLNAAGTVGHIVDPTANGAATRPIHQISVSARSAALADALSTGLCVADSKSQALRILRKVKDARLESLQTA